MPDALIAWIPRLALILNGLMFAWVGTLFMLNPVKTAGIVEIEAPTALAVSDVRAVYGGIELALAGLLLFAAIQTQWLRPALVLLITMYAGLLLGRLVTLATHGMPAAPGPMFIGIEAAGLLSGIVGLWLSAKA